MSKFARYLAPALVLSLGLGAALPASAAEPARPQSSHAQKASHKADGRKDRGHLAHANKRRDCNHGKHVAMKDRYRHGPDGHHAKGHDRDERNHRDGKGRDGRRG
jgi:hypothetical protein